MEDYRSHLKLLGLVVEDRVTLFEGVVTSVSFDLYGCVQALVVPRFNGKDTPDSRWFDTNRLKEMSSMPVMCVPDYITGIIAEKGGECLPLKD